MTRARVIPSRRAISAWLGASPLLAVVARERWGWSLLAATALTGVFLCVDLAFFGANIVKVPHGGWFPLRIGAGAYTLMATWKRGREILRRRLLATSIPLRLVLTDLEADPPHRVPGTAVFMVSTPDTTPAALVHNLAHNKVLHEQVILLSVLTEEVPHVKDSERIEMEAIGKGFYTVKVRYGFMQSPDLPQALAMLESYGLRSKSSKCGCKSPSSRRASPRALVASDRAKGRRCAGPLPTWDQGCRAWTT